MNKTTEAIIEVLEEIIHDLDYRAKSFIDNKNTVNEKGETQLAERFQAASDGIDIAIRYINEKIEELKIPLKSKRQLAKIFPKIPENNVCSGCNCKNPKECKPKKHARSN